MDHNEVARQKLTERYLLDELDADERDQFEEHFFDCPECAFDVRAGYQFVEHSKIVLADEPVAAQEAVSVRRPVDHGWFAWLRPAVAVPVLAMLLAVIGYQNLVTYPKLQAELNRPQTLPWASVAVGTWGSSGPTIEVPKGKGFLLFVRIPPDGSYARYIADLYNPAGRIECSLAIPAAAVQDQWPVLVPGANRETGSYRVSVRGITAAGESKDLGSAPFTLQDQK
jgi:Putative zinc-finger